MIENTINATINMTTRDTKDGIADLICELLGVNRMVCFQFSETFLPYLFLIYLFCPNRKLKLIC
jgi:hypothetical protein